MHVESCPAPRNVHGFALTCDTGRYEATGLDYVKDLDLVRGMIPRGPGNCIAAIQRRMPRGRTSTWTTKGAGIASDGCRGGLASMARPPRRVSR